MAVGLPVGFFVRNSKTGCLLLVTVPIAMIVYTSWWQGQNPEQLRSTSGLDFVFGPLWPSIGAIFGSLIGKWMLHWKQ
jgi:hypothetical protein